MNRGGRGRRRTERVEAVNAYWKEGEEERESIYAINSIAGPLERERKSWVH